MKESYTREIVVSNVPREAYLALTSGFALWWTDDCGSLSQAGDEISFRFGSTQWRMRAENLIPNELVELECIEAYHFHEGLPSSILGEWKGTRLKWKISREGEKTRIAFVHEGLIPSLDC